MTLKYFFGDDEYEYTPLDSDIKYYTRDWLAEDYDISRVDELVSDLDIQDRVNELYRDDLGTCFTADALEAYKANKENYGI